MSVEKLVPTMDPDVLECRACGNYYGREEYKVGEPCPNCERRQEGGEGVSDYRQ